MLIGRVSGSNPSAWAVSGDSCGTGFVCTDCTHTQQSGGAVVRGGSAGKGAGIQNCHDFIKSLVYSLIPVSAGCRESLDVSF